MRAHPALATVAVAAALVVVPARAGAQQLPGTVVPRPSVTVPRAPGMVIAPSVSGRCHALLVVPGDTSGRPMRRATGDLQVDAAMPRRMSDGAGCAARGMRTGIIGALPPRSDTLVSNQVRRLEQWLRMRPGTRMP